MKRKITITLLSLLLVAGVHTLSAREQWTVEQAWQWQERVGVIKGFNEPYPAYPGMSRADVLEKAHEVGLNSVRFWVRGETAEAPCHIAVIGPRGRRACLCDDLPATPR